MDFWTMIIQKEYQHLKTARKKPIVALRNGSSVALHSKNTLGKCCVKLNSKYDEGVQLNEVDANRANQTKSQEKGSAVNALMLPAVNTPQPTMCMWVQIHRNFATKDSEGLLGSDLSGAKADPIDDEMFVGLVRRLMLYRIPSMSSSQFCNSVAQKLEDAFSDAIIFQSISSYFNGNYTIEKYIKLTKCNFKSEPCTLNIDEPMTAPLQPTEFLRAYHKYFCPRCFVYNCDVHFGTENIEENKFMRKKKLADLKPFVEPCSSTCYLRAKNYQSRSKDSFPSTTQENTTEALANNFTDDLDNDFAQTFIPDSLEDIDRTFTYLLTGDLIFSQKLACTSANNSAETIAANSADEWSFSDQSIFLALLNVFPCNCCAIAMTMCKPCEQVYLKMQSIDPPARITATEHSRKKKRSKFHGNMQDHLKKTYLPCNHSEPCHKSSKCLCTNCEKYCCCDRDCKKRVPNCKCKSPCMTMRCVCYYGQRECDPEFCECRSCKNMDIQFGHEKKVDIISSSIHGWGVAVAETCEKSDFIGEFKGEVISNEESERRGKCCTYMFSLNGDSVLDAMFYGNEMRFLNHSNEPNCYCRVMMVNGDHRIGVYASRKIAAGEELTIHYVTYDPTE